MFLLQKTSYFLILLVFHRIQLSLPVYISQILQPMYGQYGKLYVYGSRDESPNYYCSWNYHVLSTSDLKTWTIHENSFASKGPGDQVPYSDS